MRAKGRTSIQKMIVVLIMQVYPMGMGHLKILSIAPIWLLNFCMCSFKCKCINGLIRFLALASEISLPSFQKQ